MRSDKGQAPSGYLHSVLADGAKPFRYRSGVRSLLGMPDREGGNLVFSPTLPPVGFRYEFRGESYLPPQHPPHEATRSTSNSEPPVGLKGSQDVALENIQLDAPIERAGIEFSSAFETSQQPTLEKGTGQNEVLIKDSSRQCGVMVESRQEEVFGEPSTKSEKPGTGVEGAGIEIPGISERSQSFPALSPAKQGDTRTQKTEGRPQTEVAPANSLRNLVGTSRPETEETQLARGGLRREHSAERSVTRPPIYKRSGDRPRSKLHASIQKENAPTTNTVPTSTHVSERLQKAEQAEERLVTTPSLRRTRPATVEVKVDGREVATAQKHEFPPRMAQLFVDPEESRQDKLNQILGVSAPQSVHPNIVNRSNTEAADRIEQLRQAVHHLSAKVASQPARSIYEPEQQQPQQTPPPPVEPVVIIKRSSSRARIPCAFWERSYLCHFHLRTLR